MGIRTVSSKLVGELRQPKVTSLELRGDPLNNPDVPINSAGLWAAMSGGEPTAAGETIGVHTALQQITVYACVRVLAESVASLPLKVYERQARGKHEAADHPLAYLLAVEPNEEMAAFTFWESLVGSLALTGNAYAQIQRDAGGRVIALWPLHPQLTRAVRLSSGKLVYETTDGMNAGDVRYIRTADILHIPLFSFDGLHGLSPIQLARQGIGLARASEKFGARFFGNGSKPGGVLSTESDLSDEELKAVRETWLSTQAGDKQGSTAVLPGNWKYDSIGLSPEDSQFLQTRQFQRTEIAALFRVPPNMVGDTSRLSNNNHEQMSLSFVTDTLRPYLCRIEAEIARKLLPSAGRNSGRYFISFDVTERLRGDFKTTMDGYATGRNWGWYSANDVRLELGENPGGPELDVYLVPVNMQNAARLLDTESLQDQPINSDPQVTTTPEERNLLGTFTRSCITVFRDGMGRLAHRNKRDFEAISTIFKPVLRSIANLSIEHNGLPLTGSADPADGVIDDALKAIEKRAAKWPESVTDAEIDSLAQTEFTKAVRSIHANITREIAASRAISALTPGTSNE
ncbi:HK97 family phage portal protein [Silvibacterium bohemicum]|uniref:HK97 family phage portal protein n=1 Tax=Silvibacterium bohemicum TaxID=1577686 RepID=A0A841JW00_9BACT|nr:phage portal protein [Silvibacterium bohemicum]MBB6144725.1 HK97 family phage portal protein [Silvibacterium bohemicum]